jgi:hypothetical protein
LQTPFATSRATPRDPSHVFIAGFSPSSLFFSP